MDELLELMDDDDDDDDGEAVDEVEKRPMENAVATANTINNSNNTNNDDNIKIMRRDRSNVIVTPSQSNTSKRTQVQAGRSGNSSSSNNQHRNQNRNRNQNREREREQENNTSTTSGKKTHIVESSVDDRIGIRMRNRLVPSNDLMELITDYMYFSPSVLSAMTLSRLNTLLQDPSPIIDCATVAGKTENLVTIGIVFSNSGTRISSKGGAFCVLTIGNLNSGPCLPIFLFGSAYGKYCVSCKPGTVIALMQPKLLPANRGDGNSDRSGSGSGSGSGSNGRNNNNSNSNNSTVTFSVYDIGQLKVVANAKDYGTCKASSSSRVKQNNGSWSSTGQTTCKHHVDKTISEYCDFHRRQNIGCSSNGKKQNLNKFQQVKSAHSQAAAPILVASKSNNNNNINNNKSNRFLKPTTGGVGNNNNNKKNSAIRVTATTDMMSMTKNTTNSTSSIGIRSGGNTGRNNIPMHMTKQPLNNNRSLIERKTNITTSNNSSNKYSNGTAVEKLASRNNSKRDRPNNSSSTGTGDCWLKEATSATTVRSKGTAGRRGLSLSQFTNKKSGGGGGGGTTTSTSSTINSNKKKRLINTVGCGFNGSVSIPKPNKMFQQQQTTNVTNNNVSTAALNKYTLTKKKGELMQQQSILAQRMKENESSRSSLNKKSNGSNLSKTTTTKNKGLSNSKKNSTKNIRSSNNNKSGDNNSNNAFLDAMGAIDDQEKVRNAKSQFANEVDADEYANRRRKLLELEKLEASSGRKKTQLEQQNNKRLTKEWHCQTCRKKFSLKPKGCFTQNHQVRTNYDIKKSTTKDEQRTKLHGKSADDDGLTLGSGLDWSDGNDRVGQNRFN
jgi:hypothetical protein